MKVCRLTAKVSLLVSLSDESKPEEAKLFLLMAIKDGLRHGTIEFDKVELKDFEYDEIIGDKDVSAHKRTS